MRMKDKLRELAVSLSKECGESDKDSRIRVATVRFFLKKMLAILDAEGDGGAVAWEYRNLIDGEPVEWEKCSRSTYLYWSTPENIARGVAEVRQLYTHPAQSGVVSDEDVFEHLSYIGFSKGLNGEYAPSTVARTRAALAAQGQGEAVSVDLCEDEGCPQHGIEHVCIAPTAEPVAQDKTNNIILDFT